MLQLFWRVLNILGVALNVAGHAAIGVFLTNTRLLGIKETPYKLLILGANLVAWPLFGLASSLWAGGLSSFVLSLLRPFSLGWAWRAFFTFLGARWLVQETLRRLHPAPPPAEVVGTSIRDADMRSYIAEKEGLEQSGLRGFINRQNELYKLEISTHEVKLRGLPPQFSGFTVVQLSDLHSAPFISAEFIRRYVELCLEMSPDFFALTGDYQSYSEDIEDVARLLAPIGEWSKRERGGMGAAAVLGNHDREAGEAHVTDALRRAGIPVLHNSHIALQRDGASLYIAGVADPWGLRADLGRALYGIPAGACTILLAHVPDYLVTAAGPRVALQLSGHNHGGQIQLPIIGPVLVSSRYGRRYAEGFHKLRGTLMYASRGLGGKPAIRWRCRPEIARFVLTSDE